jgi:glycosyltransferase involved in cell wall biosynthesis
MNEIPLITVGIPVFNGGKFLKRRFDSILNQTYKNLEVIISDNASTDNTSVLCEEFLHKEKNTHYYRQKKNIGALENFNYLIKNANGKYFVFAAVDDLWEPNFLEDNIKILESDEKIVGSIGNVEYFGHKGAVPKSSKWNLRLKKIIRRQDIDILKKHVLSCKGDYDKKVGKYLRFNQGSFVYGVFRTSAIKKNTIHNNLPAWDLAFILNILKFGDLHVIDEVLFHKFVGGFSSDGIISEYKRGDIGFFDMFFPIKFCSWCKKNIGFKFLLKNLDWFFVLGIFNTISFFKEIKNKL